jgi:hypothetical protein
MSQMSHSEPQLGKVSPIEISVEIVCEIGAIFATFATFRLVNFNNNP